jgi:hypothetical protein
VRQPPQPVAGQPPRQVRQPGSSSSR